MDRNTQKVGLTNLIVLLLVGGLSTGFAIYSESLVARVSLVFVGLGFLVTAVSYLQMRLEQRESMENLELQEMAQSAHDAALFSSTESEIFPARRAREQFERVVVPVFSIFLFVLQAVGTVLLWRWLAKPSTSATAVPQEPLLTMALFALFGLILFLMGKYSAGLARLEKERLLRPSASYFLLTAYIFFLVTIAIAGVQGDIRNLDLYAARALVALLGLIGLENLLNLVLEIYRPRTRTEEERLLYESRLVGFLAQPQGIITTVAQALDYQFGFKVSETWFYRFLERSLAWLLLAQAALLLLSTSLVIIHPTERALLERLGKPVAGRTVLQPGAHLKFPWPIDQVRRFETSKIQDFNIGLDGESATHEHADGEEHADTLLWTEAHHREESHMLVASRETNISTNSLSTAQQNAPPVNLVNVSIPVQYQTTNLVHWAYNYTDSASLLQDIATREVLHYLVNEDFFGLMTSGKVTAADTLKKRIQQQVNERELGVRIVYVGLENIHPAPDVASAFQAVMGAHQDKEAAILRAEGERLNTVPLARAEASQTVRQAEAYRARVTAQASAQAAQFTNKITAFKAAPKVYSQRAYLQSLENGIGDTKKIILGVTNTHDVINLNLEQKIAPDLLGADIGAPPSGSE